jgi:hypothetical protein
VSADNVISDDLEDLEPPPTKDEIAEFDNLIDEIKKHCDKHKIECVFEEDELPWNRFGKSIEARLSAGHDKRPLVIADIEKAKLALQIEFHKFRFLDSYNAYYCIEDSIVIAQLRVLNSSQISVNYASGILQGEKD